MPIFAASCGAAPSAILECGIGSVNDICTMPSPVVSPYGRRMSPVLAPWRAGAGSRSRAPPRLRSSSRRTGAVPLCGGLSSLRLQDLGRGVEVAGRPSAPRRRAPGRRRPVASSARRCRRRSRRAGRSLDSWAGSARAGRPPRASTCVRASAMNPSGAGRKSSCRPPAALSDVADVLQREVAVRQPRRDHRLGHHPDEQDALAGHRADEVEERVEQVAAEDVAGHVPGRRHPLQRGVREAARGRAARGRARGGSESGRSGSISKAWPRPSCQSCEPGLLGEVLVEQLADA